jgi:hypothetical protein
VSSFSEGPEVKKLFGVSEIGINDRIAFILGVNRNIVGDMTVIFFLLDGIILCIIYFVLVLISILGFRGKKLRYGV